MGDKASMMPKLTSEWIDILKNSKAEAPEDSSSSQQLGLMTAEDLMDHETIANRKGFKVGDIVFEKSVGPKQGLYGIVHIGEVVRVKERDPFKDIFLEARVPFDHFLTKWSAFKGDPPAKVVGDWAVACA